MAEYGNDDSYSDLGAITDGDQDKQEEASVSRYAAECGDSVGTMVGKVVGGKCGQREVGDMVFDMGRPHRG